MAGLTSTGFSIKTLDEIKTEIQEALKASPQFGPNVDLSDTSVLGQLVGIFADRERQIWELAQAVYHASYLDTATGQALSYLTAITGTIRRPATFSTVVATINVDDGVTIPAGSAANVAGKPTMRYEFTEDFTNSTGSTGNFQVTLTASTVGSSIFANTGTLTTISTPVSGWNSVTNAADSNPGLDLETDAELRLRQQSELGQQGSSNVNAIRADLLALDTVVDAFVVANPSPDTVDGIPSKAIEAVVLSNPITGDEQTIAETIFRSKPAGIQAFGPTLRLVEDDQGIEYTIGFTRPADVEIYFDIDVLVDAAFYPGDQAIVDAVLATSTQFLIGDDVIRTRFFPGLFEISGIVDVVTLAIGSTASTSENNVTINNRQRSTFDSSRITINVTTT